MTENYFCVHHKNKPKHNQHFKLAFQLLGFKLNSHFRTSNYISACRKLNLLLINSICLVVSSLEMQRGLNKPKNYKAKYSDQSTLQVFSLCLKRNNSQTYKSSSFEKIFLQCACYRYNLLRVIFLILFDSWKILFFVNVCCYFEILPAAILQLSLK